MKEWILFVALICTSANLLTWWSRNVEYFTKPAVMIVLLVYLSFSNGWQPPLIWFSLGIFFSAVGDVLLMLPKERFVLGLAAFLIANVLYILGFNQTPPPVNLASGLVVLVVLLAASRIYRRLRGVPVFPKF